MKITVKFWSYFRDLTERDETSIEVEEGETLGDLHTKVMTQFPILAEMKNSTLKAVGVDYQTDEFVLSDGDEVSLFPPVQGG
ncbi:MAG: MoaD/ThiS family protein [Verrucomicrobia subdivision 3 bacterium]|nr:MoaD/ThiS family protein [Limisphaerales bacterium]